MNGDCDDSDGIKGHLNNSRIVQVFAWSLGNCASTDFVCIARRGIDSVVVCAGDGRPSGETKVNIIPSARGATSTLDSDF